jgi:aspartate/tyrosine/aromatic aminotransferase
MTMFEKIEMAPPDPILGLEEAFKRDPNPAKINLGAGVYKDESGNTPIFRSVKLAEATILEQETSKSYLGITGAPEYAACVQALVLGDGHPAAQAKRTVTAHAPGGTGALRVAADFIKRAKPDARVWLSQPTWPNHPGVMRAAGLAVETYPYFDPQTNSLAFDRMAAALEQIPEGDVVLLHACCHNPTGADPTPDQWAAIADILARRRLVPFLDFAYQGLATGLEEDATGVRLLCDRLDEVLIASSFSKNFGLYNERVGALTFVARSADVAEAALSQIKTLIRANYSNPPAHGSKIVTTILNSPDLRGEWEGEVATMRGRINGMRRLFVDRLAGLGLDRDFSFIGQQYGMFSFTGLNKERVKRLREEYSIYIVDSGRINVAGMTQANLPVVCKAIAEVLR